MQLFDLDDNSLLCNSLQYPKNYLVLTWNTKLSLNCGKYFSYSWFDRHFIPLTTNQLPTNKAFVDNFSLLTTNYYTFNFIRFISAMLFRLRQSLITPKVKLIKFGWMHYLMVFSIYSASTKNHQCNEVDY